jgi:hypothetical protein
MTGLRSLDHRPAAGPGAGSRDRRPAGPPGDLLELQQAAGNVAVQRLLDTPVVQRLRGWGEASRIPDAELDRIVTSGLARFSAADQAELLGEHARRKGTPAAPDRTRLPTRGKIGVEVAKPSGLLAASGAAAGATSALAGRGGSGVGLDVFGGVVLADSLVTVASGYSRKEQAAKVGDTAGVNVGAAKMRSGAWDVAGGSVGVTRAGVKTGAAFGSAAVGLGAAAGGLGIAGGALSVAQGGWRAGQAAKKLWSMRNLEMLSDAGRRWKERIANREKWKVAVNALKMAAGALGIAAGILLISNPIGAAAAIGGLALTGVIVGGVMAVGKIFNKVKDAYDRRQAKKKVKAKAGAEAAPAAAPAAGKVNPKDPYAAERVALKEQADEVVRECSTNARTAGEMRAPLQALGGKPSNKLEGMEQLYNIEQGHDPLTDPGWVKQAWAITKAEPLALDSGALLKVLNVSPEEAVSESGQERIEKKLSVSESA